MVNFSLISLVLIIILDIIILLFSKKIEPSDLRTFVRIAIPLSYFVLVYGFITDMMGGGTQGFIIFFVLKIFIFIVCIIEFIRRKRLQKDISVN